MTVTYVKIPDCKCTRGEACEYSQKCVNCGGSNIVYGNWSHCCKDCNTLQDVTLLEPFIVCKRHGKFNRDEQECPKCTVKFWS